MAVGDRNSASSFTATRVPMFPHNCAEITPNDDTRFSQPVAVMVRDEGFVQVLPFGNDEDFTINVTADMIASGYFIIPFMVKAVLAGGTTATAIHGIW